MHSHQSPKFSLLLRAAALAVLVTTGLTSCGSFDAFSSIRLSEDVNYIIQDANFSGQPSQNANTNNDVKS